MLTSLIALTLLAVPQAQPQTPPPPASAQTPPAPRANPCDAPEFRQFDFWLGDWDVKGPNGGVLGANTISSIAGNCGLHENWRGAAGGSGQSVNTFHRADGKWHQVWVGTGGGILHISGGLVDGRMVLTGETTGRNGARTLQRVTWSPLPDGRVRQFWESSTDDGKTWTVAFDGFYERKR